MSTNETVADIVDKMRYGLVPKHRTDHELLTLYANRLEAAMRDMKSRIHKAMVLVAGIDMPDYNDSPKLWTALEDIYDELAAAIGGNGDIGSDFEEAMAIGRHFVVPTQSNAAAMREALEIAHDYFNSGGTLRTDAAKAVEAVLNAQPTINEKHAKPTLCKTCLHKPISVWCGIYRCSEYEEKKGGKDGK